MQRALIIVLFICYVFGLSQLGSTNALGSVIKIKISHSHAVSHHYKEMHHHAHDVLPDHSERNAKEAEGSDPENAQHHHTHEISVAGNAFDSISLQGPALQFEWVQCPYPDYPERRAPRSPGLGSIFRPPIA